MATIEQRIEALEQQAGQACQNIHVILYEGQEPTPEQRAEAAQYAHTVFVIFHEP